MENKILKNNFMEKEEEKEKLNNKKIDFSKKVRIFKYQYLLIA